jgi:hypothetical protein
MTMARKRLATEAGSPCACISVASRKSRKTNIAAASAAETRPAIDRPEAASRRARTRSPAPSARETVAEMAMVRPIVTEKATNCSWLA